MISNLASEINEDSNISCESVHEQVWFMQHCSRLSLQWYRKDPKFSDRYVWANSADTDQTAPRSSPIRSTLFAIPSASFGLIILW